MKLFKMNECLTLYERTGFKRGFVFNAVETGCSIVKRLFELLKMRGRLSGLPVCS